MTDYLKKFDSCLEGSAPYCTGACPFNMDVSSFMEKARRGSTKAAFNVFRNAVGYPRIVNSICSSLCQRVCPVSDHGGSIRIHELEKAAIALTKDTAPVDYNIPPKKERIAIIGAGTAGMAALLRLSTKKYHVEVFEKTSVTGGWLRQILDDDIIDADFSEQLQFQDYIMHMDTEIRSVDELSGRGFDAVLAATGDDGPDFGLRDAVSDKGDRFCTSYDGTGWFAAGGITGTDVTGAVANGLHMGTVIDNYLRTDSLYYPPYSRETALCEGMVTFNKDIPAVVPEGTVYTKEEFASEASRCADCRCSYCMQHCDLCDFTGKWPQKLRDEVIATTLEGKTELKATPARRIMSLCNQCGLCSEVCPEGIDMDRLFMIGRQKMYKQGKMPWAFHDFFIRDMEQANGEASLIRKPIDRSTGREYDKCSYAFFPGCQLGASEPEIVVKVYDSLLFKHPDTAIFLHCCGIPAGWEGDAERHREILESITAEWEKLGRPVMIMACMSCVKTFKEQLPDIPVTTIYEMLDKLRISGGCNSVDYSIFHPCPARHENGVRKAVADLAESMGVTLHPLDENEEYAKCCGYGGHGSIADERYGSFVAEKRIADGEYPYITYCINCRDMFKMNGKDAVHILELIYGMGASNQHMKHEHDHGHDHGSHDEDEHEDTEPAVSAPLPTVTQKQRNRMELKQAMLSLFWDEFIEIEDDMYGLTLLISDEIKQKMDRKHILEKEVAQVIDFCQRTGRTVTNTETGTLTGYSQVGRMTYWVEYRPYGTSGKEFEVVNVYSHRLKIELEAVWNGVRKADEM